MTLPYEMMVQRTATRIPEPTEESLKRKDIEQECSIADRSGEET